MLDIGILGRLRVIRDGEEVNLLKRRSRRTLGILITRRGQEVPTDEIIGLLWGDSQPDTAPTCVYNDIGEIRGQIVPPGAEDPVETLRGRRGYRFNPEHVRFDDTRFTALADSADEAADRGDLKAALNDYEKALSEWEGRELRTQPMSDVPLPAQIRKELARLTERRLTVQEEWCGTALRLGRPRKALPSLRALSVEKPLSEPVHVKLMRAEAWTGNPDTACDVFDTFSRRLLKAKNRKPSGSMSRLCTQIRDGETTGGRPFVA